ncbi:SPFH domain-containing protein [Photobacterium gaetbulicola]|uniref:SPFH domain-containing protein n=1 Tax=Photobacterium gaetbulicola TaxID=1295392 RepID=UPI000A89281D|nr:SPFH domain-containing protein [Photobacterium gaetbulicola]
MFTNKHIKFIPYAVVGLTLVGLGLNSFIIVDAGTANVQTIFGKVNPNHYGEGFHFPVNPFSTFDTYDTRNARYEVNGLNIPTQDRFNSTGNVTVLYRIDDAKTPLIKQNYGTASEYIDKTMRQHLRSIVRDEGRKLKDSRNLAQSDNVTMMQDNTRSRLTNALEHTGIEIQEVLIQDIEFDRRIAQQILDTQMRIQAEEQKKSQERIAATEAEIKRQQAIGEANKQREQADAKAYSVREVANAEKAAAIARAQGEAEAIKLLAEANLELTKSLTPEVIEKQRLDNEQILFSKSKGAVPHTVIGDTDLRAIGVPILNK